jgi:hypothetical protein
MSLCVTKFKDCFIAYVCITLSSEIMSLGDR